MNVAHKMHDELESLKPRLLGLTNILKHGRRARKLIDGTVPSDPCLDNPCSNRTARAETGISTKCNHLFRAGRWRTLSAQFAGVNEVFIAEDCRRSLPE